MFALRSALFLVLAAAIAPAGAQTGPLLTCLEPLYDFGALINTQVVEHVFLLHNSGGATAVVSRIQTSCDCITGSAISMRLPPGGTEPLTARFDLRGMSGPQIQSIEVSWGERSPDCLRLALIGRSIAVVDADPPALAFDAVALTSTPTQVVRIFCALSNQPFRVASAVCTSDFFTVAADTSMPAVTHQVRITATPRRPGRFNALMTVTTDKPEVPFLRIPLQLFVPIPAEPPSGTAN